MQRVFKKIIFSMLTIFLSCGFVFAIDNEYKNSLVKIELSKKDANSYNINLITQKKYSEPVKVIKKNDLNYYILLPETKNTTSGLNSVLQDVKSITTSSYNYANQDKNGYTKININTTKPVNFNINVKSLSQAAQSKPAAAAAKQPAANKIATAQTSTAQAQKAEVQKKNLVKTQAKSVVLPTSLEKNQAAANIAKENKKETSKTQNVKKQVLKNDTQKTAQKKVKTNAPKANSNKIAQQPVAKVPVEIQKETPAQIEKEPLQTDLEEEQQEETAAQEPQQENIEQPAPQENLTEQEEVAQNNNLENNNQILNLLFKIKNKTSLYLANQNFSYKKAIKYAILAAFIFLAASLFVASVLAIIFKNKKKNSRIRESLGLSGFKKDSGDVQEEKKKDTNGQYFVFDKNISQSFFNTDDDSKKHYELSAYEPDIQINYEKRSLIKDKNKKYTTQISKSKNKDKIENEYDIIQKILKEDSLIEFRTDELESIENLPLKEPATQKTKTVQKVKVKEKPKKTSGQPVVLSSVEIAPERGFMCVAYNDNINLLGYIFDDVFALYNFKQPKLENYDIKFRLSEKDEKGANFIVRVGDSKMLIRVTKSFMTLEVLM